MQNICCTRKIKNICYWHYKNKLFFYPGFSIRQNLKHQKRMLCAFTSLPIKILALSSKVEADSVV